MVGRRQHRCCCLAVRLNTWIAALLQASWRSIHDPARQMQDRQTQRQQIWLMVDLDQPCLWPGLAFSPSQPPAIGFSILAWLLMCMERQQAITSKVPAFNDETCKRSIETLYCTAKILTVIIRAWISNILHVSAAPQTASAAAPATSRSDYAAFIGSRAPVQHSAATNRCVSVLQVRLLPPHVPPHVQAACHARPPSAAC